MTSRAAPPGADPRFTSAPAARRGTLRADFDYRTPLFVEGWALGGAAGAALGVFALSRRRRRGESP